MTRLGRPPVPDAAMPALRLTLATLTGLVDLYPHVPRQKALRLLLEERYIHGRKPHVWPTQGQGAVIRASLPQALLTALDAERGEADRGAWIGGVVASYDVKETGR